MPDDFQPPQRSWPRKFADALRGIRIGVRGQSSFKVHLIVAVLVIIAGTVLQVSRIEWCLLTICITMVLTAEMFNSALEILSRAVDRKYNPLLRDALDIGSGAVLTSACGAVVVGLIVFLFRLGVWLAWWPEVP